MSDVPSRSRNHPILLLVTGSWIAQLGLGLSLTAVITWLFLLTVELRSGKENPYIGIALVIGVPVLLVVGIALTFVGVWRSRARLEQRLEQGIDDRRLAFRRLATFGVLTGIANLAIGTQVTYRAVHHMESRQFCGSCHVMTPETSAFGKGTHAGILCVDCHVGAGAKGWIDSKIGGTRQLIEVLTDNVKKPIPSAIESGRMVPSAETCEECHWRDKPGAVRVRVLQRFDDDEANTPKTTVLTMQVGGRDMPGIHGAHFGNGAKVRFVATDAKRQVIPWVEYTAPGTGEVHTYVQEDANPADYADAPKIEMQCIDCHNRAAHTFLPPAEAVDQALTLGHMSATLPFLKRESVRILSEKYATNAEAAARIPQALAEFYRTQQPEVSASRAGDVEEAGRVLADVYARNVFPDWDVDWKTYPDNSGHKESSPGCFRCHGGDHETSDGDAITSDCFTCHWAAAAKETEPEVLKALGLDRPMKAMRR